MEITIEDLKQIRNYFGEHDVSIFEHKAFDIMNTLVKEREVKSIVNIYKEEVRQGLDLAQAEIRSMYKRLGIEGSNVLNEIDKTLSGITCCGRCDGVNDICIADREESKTIRNAEIIGNFIEHCKTGGTDIPDTCFESYFGA